MKTNLILAIAAVATLGAVSCGKTPETPQTTFKSYTTSSTYVLEGSAEDMGLSADLICSDSVSLVMPETLNAQEVPALRDSIVYRALGVRSVSVDTAIDQFFADTKAESGYKAVTSTIPGSAADGYTRVSGYVVNMTPSLLVYCICTNKYIPHAANGMTTLDYINYSMSDNSFIRLDNLFTSDGIEKLPEMISRQAENIPAYAGNVDITELPVDGNFYLSSEGEIVFSYQPMEVGPHYLGPVQVAFYPYELAAIMKPAAKAMFGVQDL